MNISKNSIIKINKFMDNFLQFPYTGKNKLTHKEMKIFLKEKNKEQPKSVDINFIKKEDILKGNFLFVIDECGQIIPYQNPFNLNSLFQTMQIEKEHINFESRRKKVLKKHKKESKRNVRFTKVK